MLNKNNTTSNLTRSIAAPFLAPLKRFGFAAANYNLKSLRADALAGLTVSFVSVPQAMAYALIAGVPAQYGLYTIIIQCFLNTIFGSHPILSVGPTNTQALLTASIVGILAPGDPALYLSLVISLTLIKGVIQILMSEARLGQLVKFVSSPVIVGFTAGAAILIGCGQMNNFLGFAVERSPGDWPGIVGIGQRLIPHLWETSPYAIVIGLIALAIVLITRRMSRMIPGPLIAILGSAAIVFLLGLSNHQLTLFSPIPSAVPSFQLPAFSMEILDNLLVGATALAVLGMLEAYSIGRAITAKRGGTISANSELFSQGIINFLSSFFMCIPGSGSFARSALNEFSGAKTCFSSIANSGCVLVLVLLIKVIFPFIPQTAIAAILFVVAFGLIDVRFMGRLYRANKFDFAVCIATLLATLLLPLAYAVFVGIAINIALYLQQSTQLRMHELIHNPATGHFHELQADGDGQSKKDMVFLHLEGDLYFALADELQIQLAKAGRASSHSVILRLKHVHSIDSSSLGVIEQFVEDAKGQGKHVILAGVHSGIRKSLKRFGIIDLVGREHVFYATSQRFEASKKAIAHARELI